MHNLLRVFLCWTVYYRFKWISRDYYGMYDEWSRRTVKRSSLMELCLVNVNNTWLPSSMRGTHVYTGKCAIVENTPTSKLPDVTISFEGIKSGKPKIICVFSFNTFQLDFLSLYCTPLASFSLLYEAYLSVKWIFEMYNYTVWQNIIASIVLLNAYIKIAYTTIRNSNILEKKFFSLVSFT